MNSICIILKEKITRSDSFTMAFYCLVIRQDL